MVEGAVYFWEKDIPAMIAGSSGSLSRLWAVSSLQVRSKLLGALTRSLQLLYNAKKLLP